MKYRRYPLDPVLRRSDFRCVYCGRDLLSDPETLITAARDHLVPKSAGGPDTPDNRVALCAACDRLKGATVVASVDEARVIIAGRRLGHEHWFQLVLAEVRG